MIVFHCLLVRLRARRRRIHSWGCCLPPPTSSDNVADLYIPCISAAASTLDWHCLAGIWVSIILPLVIQDSQQTLGRSPPQCSLRFRIPLCAHSLPFWRLSRPLDSLVSLNSLSSLEPSAAMLDCTLGTANRSRLQPNLLGSLSAYACSLMASKLGNVIRPPVGSRRCGLLPLLLDGSHLYLAEWRPTPCEEAP